MAGCGGRFGPRHQAGEAEEEYKEEIERLEEENMKVKEMFLELFRSKSDA